MNSQQNNNEVQTLSGFEKVIRVIGIILIIGFAFELLFFAVGYVGLVHLKIKTVLWLFWNFVYVILMLISPIILIITIASAGYMLLRVLKKTANRKVAIIAIIAVGMNLLVLLGAHLLGKGFYHHAQQFIQDMPKEKDWTDQALPDFTFQGIQEGVAPITIKDLQGKPSVLAFWATYDTGWASTFKVVQELYKQREKLNINVLAIATDDSKEDVKKFLQRHPGNMPVYHDPKTNYGDSLTVRGAVEMVFIVDSMTRGLVVLKISENTLSSDLDRVKAVLDGIQP